MGAETSVLQGCKLEDPLPTPSQKDWTIHPAQRKDGSRVSVFVHKKKQEAESSKEQHLENAARQLKILRHPTILKFFASCENVDGTFLITEQVKPLDLVIDTITPEEICAGLYNVVEALSFLHERGGVSHNNVCMSTIYVSSQDGGWRLGGMEHLCKFEDATVQFLKQSKPLRNAQCIPPEEDVESLTSTAPSYGHARDAYAFGVLAQNMLEYLGDLGEMTDTFEASIGRMLDLEPINRPKLGTLMCDKLFKNDFLEITNFVKHLTLKSEVEKNAFFEGLAARLHRLPKQLVASRLAPLLVSSFVMAEPMAINHLFPHLLAPCRDVGSQRHHEFLPNQTNPLIPLELFVRYVIPVLGKVFPLRELHVRSVLLRHFSSYGDLFYEEKLQNVILPQLLLGLKDTHDDIVAASLRALSDLVPILGARTVVGGERAKYFVEGRPKFPKPQESPLNKKDDVTYLTAVSGVITLPMLDKALTSPPVGSKVMTHKAPANVTNNGDMDQAVRKQERERQKEERERRREEMRCKNEERRKEREKKREEIGKVTLASLAQSRVKDMSTDSSDDDDNSTVPSMSSSDHRQEREPPKTPSSQSYEIVQDSEASTNESDKADWSDWDDVEKGNDEPISIQNGKDLVVTTSQSESMFDTDRDIVKIADDSRTSNGIKKPSDWSDNWDETETDLSVSNQEVRAPKKDVQVPKKKTNALQLKSSLKKKDNSKKDNEEKMKDESKQSVVSKTQHKNKIKKSATNTTQKTSTRVGQNKTPQDLGKEYDIPDITVVTTPEPDFFADMEPTMRFGSSSSSISGATKEKESSKPVATATTPVISSNSVSFAVDNSAVTGDGDDDGWGEDDDFNWDEEAES